MSRLAAALKEPLRILRPFWPLALFATVMGGASGLASAGLVATVNRILNTPGEQAYGVLLAFAGFFVVAVAGELVGGIGNSLVGQKILAALRMDLAAKILAAPLAEIERYKSHRLIAALDRDVSTIGAFTFNFSTLSIAFAIAAGCFGYLAYLSPAMFLIALAAATADIAVQWFAAHRARRNFDAVRGAHDELQKHYRTMIEGAKELRLNRARRAAFVTGQLGPTIDGIVRQFMRAAGTFYSARVLNTAIFFGALFVILSLGARLAIEATVLSGFVLVLLYVRGPIEQLIGALPMFGEAQVSLRRVAELEAAFSRETPEAGQVQPSSFAGESIALKGACYAFPAPEGGQGFVLGPIDLTIRKGELVLITGANGTGKTTLIKLLLSLYTPTEGALLCDSKPVAPTQADDYRQLFSAVFFDYFLFQELLADGDTVREEVERHLARLEIAHKVEVRQNAFSTIELSTGQRKRLALIHVMLENRPFVVLDEWAADQDPAYRRVFYRELLPELKRMGKTLIVVSHDDRYFDVADRLIKMEGGRIIEQAVPAAIADHRVGQAAAG